MKPMNAWLLALCAISFVACDNSDDPVNGGTEVAGTEAGTMVAGTEAGTMVAGTEAGTMVAGTEAGTMMAGTMVAGMEAGTIMAGTMVAGTEGPGCTDSLEVGASCDLFNDCCARGTQCTDTAGDGSNAVCLRKCDANADVTGCEARELCNPESADVPAGMESPGVCIIGDECEPGNENLACGEGEFSCLRAQNITFCLGDLADIREQAPEALVGTGEACNPFDQMAPTFCEQGLVCEYGVCRDLCDTTEDCGGNGECVDYTNRVDGIPYKFCLNSCDIYAQDCGEGEACVLADSYDGGAVGICDGAAGASGTALSGEECTTSETNYWGTCEAGNLCSVEAEGDTTGECVSFCDSYNLDRCTGDYAACLTGVFDGLDDMGICNGECDIMTNAGCAEGQSCLFGNEGTNSTDEPVPTGFCYDNTNAGTLMPGETCTVGSLEQGGQSFEYPFLSDCAPGNMCLQIMQGQDPQCLQMCNPSAADSGCEQGVNCIELFDGITTVGVCFAG